ncbi:ribonuclease H2 subunit B-like isoform X1 [Amphibalanus amphitrite]|uniref:ribonuclease H2 subunit B-like isoform X1 n=2 Tax=Amphibalanus amphitrite TaxID=1232801 RepID=UPI001C92746B|nr:ribonuclease H2 subunit B-like isoform X1 [Amphibalanus amphitrite]XP_043222817.1 ribonuclease H2 subunit B-like isoform X1 [Amphibalanus amphitrite]XP_043222819.1 ribonuclease H2 subunit B-like isoform X1 [Amphibalanus amphitrite]XP_043222820.1 ribonuclease H2 subunit B-like isoform X1 [Amphibalanus amphitrite]
MGDNKHKIFIIKDNATVTGSEDRQLDALRLRHPKTGQAAAFLLDADSKELLEVQTFDDSPRSWFVGSAVETDGHIHVCSPLDPLYIVLVYMQQSRYAQQLDQLLSDHQFPDTVRLADSVGSDRLELIADRKGDSELNAYKYNEERAVAWLERRTRRLAAVLEAKRLHGTSGKADNFVKVREEEVDKAVYLRFAWGLTSEYLSSELSAALRCRLQLPDERPKRSQPAAEPPAKRARGAAAPAAPLEDYSQPASNAKKVLAPKNAKQKALAKSAIGTKSIASFFKKK